MTELIPLTSPTDSTEALNAAASSNKPKPFWLDKYLQSSSALVIFVGFLVLSLFVVTVEKAKFMFTFEASEDLGISHDMLL